MQTNALILEDRFVKFIRRMRKEKALKSKIILILLLPVFLLNMNFPSSTHAAPKVQFTLIYTNDVMGEVEPCG